MFELSRSKNINFLKLAKYSRHFFQKLPTLRRRRKARLIIKIVRFTIVFVLGLFIIVIIFLAIKIKDFQNIINFSLQGKEYAELSVAEFKNLKINEAEIYAHEAKTSFTASREILDDFENDWLINSRIFRGQLHELTTLVDTALILSTTLEDLAEIGKEFIPLVDEKTDGFSKLTMDEKRIVLASIYKNIPELYGIKANINLALINLEKIKARGILLLARKNISGIKDNLLKINTIMADGLPLLETVPLLMGYPEESNFLFILQNNDELRPTGGFIGTFGVVETKDGEILKFATHDIYHLDMPVADKLNITPPQEIRQYLNLDRWFMRDANWSPDWPVTANKINWFYHEENKLLPKKDEFDDYAENFDGVIGITPALIEDLLKVIGPISIEDELYTSENFQKLLQYKVEKGYEQLGVPSWHRKEVIGEIAKQLKIRIFDKGVLDLADIFSLAQKSLAQKDILIYYFDPHYQEIIDGKNWSGRIIDLEDDYFYVVDSNMASLKTDAVMDKNITYQMTQSLGGLFSNLYVNYKHNGEFDWRTTRYQTYTRVYLPKDCQIMEVSGFEADSVNIDDDADKTVVGGFLVVEPGKIGNLHIYYKLPEVINNKVKSGYYSLSAQKQPGNNIEFLTVDLGFISDIKSTYQPTGFNVFRDDDKKIRWETNLLTDKNFSLELK